MTDPKFLNGEIPTEIVTKRRGKDPVIVKVVITTPELYHAFIHNKLLEAKREGKKLLIQGN